MGRILKKDQERIDIEKMDNIKGNRDKTAIETRQQVGRNMTNKSYPLAHPTSLGTSFPLHGSTKQ